MLLHDGQFQFQTMKSEMILIKKKEENLVIDRHLAINVNHEQFEKSIIRYSFLEMSKKKHDEHKEAIENDESFTLNDLKIPLHVSHVKPGNTLCTNDEFLILQNGSTTIEIRSPPQFRPKQVPWRDGMLRDISWCPELGIFILLTQKAVFAFNSKPLVAPPPPITAATNNDSQLTIISLW